jgi:cupin fold WbuC family metalloprotein
MIKVRKESDEVLYPEDDLVLVAKEDLYELKRRASLNPRKRIRLCAHRSPDDRLHEMFIVHARECYVRPHRHLENAESMLILEGEVDVVLFHEDGSLRQIIQMGAPGTGKVFYQRLPSLVYHCLLIRTEFLVFNEVVEGPFIRENTEFPEWAPVEDASGEFRARIEALMLSEER